MATSTSSQVLLRRLLYWRHSSEIRSLSVKIQSILISALPFRSRCLSVLSPTRSYSSKGRRKQTDQDPLRNVRYPFTPGDPIQADAISNLKSNKALNGIAERDRRVDEKKRKTMKANQSIVELKSGLKYQKLLEGDIRLGNIISAAKSNNPKKPSDTIVVEGQRLISDALALGAEMKCLYFCDTKNLESFPHHHLENVSLYKIFYKVMKTWSDTTTPSGLLGIFKKPQKGEAISSAETVLPITLIFDSLKDPGNAGTLIRTAAAIGCERIIATRGSVNLWDGKVLRSAMGGHFSIPIYTGLRWSDVGNYVDENTHVFLANSRPAHVLDRAFDSSLQSEDVEGLNHTMSEDEDGMDYSGLTEKEREEVDGQAERDAYNYHNVPLNVYNYSDIKFNQSQVKSETDIKAEQPVSVALVVGGETEGLSAQAKKFAYQHYGHYVTIPMNSTVNSLNAGVAGSVILYELSRKLTMIEMESKRNSEKDNTECMETF